MMRAVPAHPFAMGVDTVVSLTPGMCSALKSAGMRFAVRYLGGVGLLEVGTILDAGLAFMPVTYAGQYDGFRAVQHMHDLNLPRGCTVWLDVEGAQETPLELAAKINAWAHSVQAAGFDAGLYVGAGALLTSAQLYGLAVDRYWHSCSRVTDIAGAESAPACGWSMYQLNPYNTQVAGVTVDVDVIQQDYKGRVPTWVEG